MHTSATNQDWIRFMPLQGSPWGLAKWVVYMTPFVILGYDFQYKKIFFGNQKLSYKAILIISGVILSGQPCIAHQISFWRREVPLWDNFLELTLNLVRNQLYFATLDSCSPHHHLMNHHRGSQSQMNHKMVLASTWICNIFSVDV